MESKTIPLREKFSLSRLVFVGYLFLIFSVLSSCSYFKRRSLFGEDKKDKTVSQEQYDNLLEKYQSLVRETRDQPKVKPAKQKEMIAAKRQDLLDSLKAAPQGELKGTVNPFKNEQSQMSSLPPQYESKLVAQEISDLRKAMLLVGKNKFGEALSMLKSLEKSQVRPIAVQAKYYIGESLFRQGEWDLAMQVYEGIIHNDAFSGVVLKALGKLIVCSEKLKLSQKRDRYYSMLHDFFEAG